MRKIPGFSDRLRLAMKWAGQWERDKPNVPDFSRIHGWRDQDMRAYLDPVKTRVPDYPTLKRLAGNLDVPVTWLACGDDALSEIAELGKLREALKTGRPYKKNPSESKRSKAS